MTATAKRPFTQVPILRHPDKPLPPWHVARPRIVRAALREAARDTSDFPIAKRVYIAVDDDADRARERVRATLRAFYGDAMPDLTPVAIVGPPDVCARGLREIIDAGAERILLTPMFDEAEQMERLVAEVVPQLS